METRLDDIPMEPACIARHVGPWMVETGRFCAAVTAVKAGHFVADRVEPDHAALYTIDSDGIAAIPIIGFMMKGDSKFGGTNTVRTRRAVRRATEDKAVKASLLHIAAPGGTAAGTGELASDVRMANAVKPVYAHIEDLGASAAYWVASQARRITATPTAEIGSIGTVAVVEDSSGAMEMAGIRVHVISTGAHKGQFVDGAPVTEEQLDDLQRMVNEHSAHFFEGVRIGRKMPIAKVREIADGRTWLAAKAREMGLIDKVATIDEALKLIHRDLRATEQRRQALELAQVRAS